MRKCPVGGDTGFTIMDTLHILAAQISMVTGAVIFIGPVTALIAEGNRVVKHNRDLWRWHCFP